MSTVKVKLSNSISDRAGESDYSIIESKNETLINLGPRPGDVDDDGTGEVSGPVEIESLTD